MANLNRSHHCNTRWGSNRFTDLALLFDTLVICIITKCACLGETVGRREGETESRRSDGIAVGGCVRGLSGMFIVITNVYRNTFLPPSLGVYFSCLDVMTNLLWWYRWGRIIWGPVCCYQNTPKYSSALVGWYFNSLDVYLKVRCESEWWVRMFVLTKIHQNTCLPLLDATSTL